MEKIELPDGKKVWLVASHEDARRVLTDPRFSNDASRMGEMAPLASFPESIRSIVAHDMLNTDAPVHTRLRRLVAPAFTLRRLTDYRPHVERIAQELIDGFGSHPDLVADYAGPLATRVLGELVGIDPADAPDVRRWSDLFVLDLLTLSEEATRATRSLAGFARHLVARRRADPRDDLVSRLVTLRDNEDRLSDAELASMVFILLVAGQTATTQLLAKALHLLLTNRDQLDLVLARQELLPHAVQEVLRLDPPLRMSSFRMATEPVEIAGTVVPPGDIVVVSLRDANRDPDRFPEPDSFDVRRAEKQHLAFGHGVHRCVGANLAELQCQVGLAAFFRAFPHSKVLDDGVTWRPTPLITVLAELPVAVG